MTPPDGPSDNTTLTDVVAGYTADGFTGEFEIVEHSGDLRCFTCSTVTASRDVPIHSIRRLEGASDPADMVSIVAVTCPTCRARGVLVVKYGPEATIDEAEFLVHARDQRSDDVAPGAAAPDEAQASERRT